MSVSYYADLIVGIRLKRDDLYVEKTIPGCDHEIPKTAKFCPECGKPAAKTERSPLPKYDEDDKYGHLDVVRIGYEGDEVVVGRVLSRVGGWKDTYVESVTTQEIVDAQAKVMKMLEQEPIKGEFGVWLCLRAS